MMGAGLRVAGFAITAIGILVIAIALRLSITLPTGLYDLGPTKSDVVNLSMMQTQLLTFIGGCSLSVVGSILAVGGFLHDREVVQPDHRGAPNAAGKTSAPIASLPAEKALPSLTEDERRAQAREMDGFMIKVIIGIVAVGGIVAVVVQLFVA
jgi:hypothetical protein